MLRPAASEHKWNEAFLLSQEHWLSGGGGKHRQMERIPEGI